MSHHWCQLGFPYKFSIRWALVSVQVLPCELLRACVCWCWLEQLIYFVILLFAGCFISHKQTLCDSRWFHGKIKREEAEDLLQPRTAGLFLVRESNNFPGDYTLCVVSDELKVEHYHILYENNKLTLDSETYFENLIPLVEVGVLSPTVYSCCQQMAVRSPMCSVAALSEGRWRTLL